MEDIQKLVRIQMVVFVLFVFGKLIRPSVLNSNAPDLFKIILLSLPNFFEAIIGTLLLTGIGLYLHDKWLKSIRNISVRSIYVVSILLAGIYVLSQEYKIHNLGGNNVFDVYDVIFSILGLLTSSFLIWYIKPQISSN